MAHNQIMAAQRLHTELELKVRWMPGNEGITGKERADVEAKKVASGETSAQELLPIPLRQKIPVGKSVAYQGYMKKIQKSSAEWFTNSLRYHHMREIDRSIPSSKLRKDTHDLTCRQMSLLVQLRLGHAPLNKHLHQIGKAKSPRCPVCRASDKTVHHFLVTCPKYVSQWRLLEGKLWRAARSVSTLLSNPRAFVHLFKYVHITQRLHKMAVGP